MLHTVYQLIIDSELALPELLTLTDTQAASTVDVRVRLGDVSPEGLPQGRHVAPFLWASRDALWFQVPDVARFLVEGGRQIVIDPQPGVDEASVRVFLLGSALAALLMQRGYLVLHGNAIAIGQHCLVCVGNSGTGKSTLSAGLVQRGHRLLADDVVPIDRDGRALPGFPRIKLWKDTAAHLGIDTTDLPRIRPGLDKFSYPLFDQFSPTPLTVRWVFILDSHHHSDILLEPVRGMHRLGPLCDNTYRARFLEGLELRAEHLQLCGPLASRIRLVRVTRPDKGFELNALIDRIETDLAANP